MFLLSFSKPISFKPMDTAENDRPKVEEYEVYHYLTNIDQHRNQLYWRTSPLGSPNTMQISHIINSILSGTIFLPLWKRAEVIPVPKLKNPSLRNNFRPIHLLFYLSKNNWKSDISKNNKRHANLEPSVCNTSWRGVEDALLWYYVCQS